MTSAGLYGRLTRQSLVAEISDGFEDLLSSACCWRNIVLLLHRNNNDLNDAAVRSATVSAAVGSTCQLETASVYHVFYSASQSVRSSRVRASNLQVARTVRTRSCEAQLYAVVLPTVDVLLLLTWCLARITTTKVQAAARSFQVGIDKHVDPSRKCPRFKMAQYLQRSGLSRVVWKRHAETFHRK